MSSSIESTGRLEFSTVWEKGEEGTEAFGCFGLCVTGNNDVLAFCEGRIGWRDYDPQHLFCKRSTDGGRIWGKNKVLCESRSGEIFHNPTPVMDRESGFIFVFYGDCKENKSSRVCYLRSDDGGESWSEPFDVTDLFKMDPKQRAFHLPGPGHGIQMQSGRLTVPVWHRHAVDNSFLPHISERQYAISVVYSDDGGASWQNGQYTDSWNEPGLNAQANESRCLELADGTLLMNARMGIPHRLAIGPNRVIGLSCDGGITWDPNPYTAFNASFLTDSPSIAYNQDRQIFARPNCLNTSSQSHPENGRRNMTVYLCRNGMKEILNQRVIDPGNAYYSDLCLLPDHTILLLYGKGFLNNWMGNEVRCACFDLDWLQGS